MTISPRIVQIARYSALLAMLWFTGHASAGPQQGKKATRPHCEAVPGVLLQHSSGKTWQPVKPGDDIPFEAELVALPKAEILSPNGAIRLAMLADIGHRAPLPVLESAVTLHTTDKADLDFTFGRGLIGLRNEKKAGAAKARIRLPGDTWELTLNEPGTTVVLELYGRHVPGPLLRGKGTMQAPESEVYLLVLKGQGFLDVGPKGFRITAPPGPASVHWDTVSRQVDVRRLEKLPKGARPLDDKESKVYQAICTCASTLAKNKDLGAALDHLMQSNEKVDRLLGVTAAGAVDDLPRVLAGLTDRKHADLRDHTILVLRSWIGRGPGQIEKLHDALLQAKYSRVQARTIERLLVGFNTEERRDPVTYELLIASLKHSRLPVRELARWHLFRLAPAGRNIPYDAAAPAADRQRAFNAWRALIPEGKLPPPPKESSSSK